MILHTGADGGLHDVVATNLFTAIAWGLLGVNAAVYYARQLWGKMKKSSQRVDSKSVSL